MSPARRWLHAVVDPVGGRTLAAAVVIMVAYGLWQVFRWGGHQHQALIGDLSFFPPNAAGGYCAWRVSRRTDLGRPTIRAWRLLSVAIWLYLLGDGIQLIYEVVLHQRPDPTWADAAYLAFYPVACAGFFAFPSRRRTRPERLRILFDTGTVFVGGETFLWYAALGPAVASRPGFDLPDLVIFAYPIGDLLLLFGVLSLLWRGVPRASVLPLRIFASGMLMFIVADATYDYSTINAPYNGGDPVDTKQINDVHGHAAGDRVLADLAQTCREQVRPDDVAGRYGGDEFIIVIPEISSLRAIQIAARLTGPPARTSGADGQPVAFSVSVGIAELGACLDLPILLAHADAAMYEAKRAGGGCWRLYEDSEQAAVQV